MRTLKGFVAIGVLSLGPASADAARKAIEPTANLISGAGSTESSTVVGVVWVPGGRLNASRARARHAPDEGLIE
jgi:hypothetical protein